MDTVVISDSPDKPRTSGYIGNLTTELQASLGKMSGLRLMTIIYIDTPSSRWKERVVPKIIGKWLPVGSSSDRTTTALNRSYDEGDSVIN
jgi:hypothetical protein